MVRRGQLLQLESIEYSPFYCITLYKLEKFQLFSIPTEKQEFIPSIATKSFLLYKLFDFSIVNGAH